GPRLRVRRSAPRPRGGRRARARAAGVREGEARAAQVSARRGLRGRAPEDRHGEDPALQASLAQPLLSRLPSDLLRAKGARAERAHPAILAAWSLCAADAASVEDEQVRREVPVALR